MAELCPADSARARKIESLILQRLASVGNARAADFVGLDESTVSRWKREKDNGDPSEIQRIALFLTALGLKATPQEYKCYDEPTLNAMLTLARQRMDQINSVEHLQFEDDK